MPRYYRRYRTRSSKKVRYSNETTAVNIQTQIGAGATPTFPSYQNPAQTGFSLVPATLVQGTRKVKNMSLSLNVYSIDVPLYGAVVYVPSGTNSQNMGHAAGNAPNPVSLYEPNQNVIMQFVVNPIDPAATGQSVVQRFKTRLARNLESGDEIRLIFTPAVASGNQTNPQIVGTFNYAIAY